MNAYEFFTSTLEPLWRMTPGAGIAPLLLDRHVKLAPVIDGYGMPAFYHWLLAPFSGRPVGSTVFWLQGGYVGCAKITPQKASS